MASSSTSQHTNTEKRSEISQVTQRISFKGKGYLGQEYDKLEEFSRSVRDFNGTIMHKMYGTSDRFKDLYKAAMEGNWDSAHEFLKNHPYGLHTNLSVAGFKLLHVATYFGHLQFFKKLLQHYAPEELKSITDRQYNTALHYAVLWAKVEVAKLLVEKYPALTEIKNKNGSIPILLAAAAYASPPEKDRKEMLLYLVKKTTNPFVPPDQPNTPLLSLLTFMGLHDVTLRILRRHPERTFIKERDNEVGPAGTEILTILAQYRAVDFKSLTRLGFWDNLMYKLVPDDEPSCLHKGDIEAPLDNGKPPKQIVDPPSHHQISVVRRLLRGQAWKLAQKLAPGPSEKIRKIKCRHEFAQKLVLFVRDQAKDLNLKRLTLITTWNFLHIAAGSGIVEIISPWLKEFPLLFEYVDEKLATPLHVAVLNRQDKIYNIMVKVDRTKIRTLANLVVNISLVKKDSPGVVVTTRCNLLRLAAMLAPPRRLKSVSGPALQMQREWQWFQEVAQLTDPGFEEAFFETPRDVFTEEHKDLVEKAEQWLKDTSGSCMVVTTLVATVVFAAAFTVPGGNNSQGLPNFINETKFTTFIVSDSLALFSSLTSLLMFLSILTSRYTDEDFGKKLPMKLMIGLLFLFVAMASMMIAFVASIWIILVDKPFWASVLATIGAAIPVIDFLVLQLHMSVRTFVNTFRYHISTSQHVFGHNR